MNKLLFTFIFILFSIRAAGQSVSDSSMLWEISSKNGSSPSYLFGTIHLICAADFKITDALKSKIAASKQLALEIDMDDPAMMGKMMKSALMKGDHQLKNLLTKEEYTRLERFYKDSIGMSIDMFNKMKPFVLMGPLYGKVLDCEPQSYEMKLTEMAAAQHIEVVGLESIEEQMAVFDTISYQDQVKMVLAMIDSLPKARQELAAMIEYYKAGQSESLFQMSIKSDYGMEGDEKILLSDRNHRWIDRMSKMMEEKPTLFAVGAAHLGGPDGVVRLLRKAGYIVKPVSNQ